MKIRSHHRTWALPALCAGALLGATGCYNFAARQRAIDENERKVQETTGQIHDEMERRKALEPPAPPLPTEGKKEIP